MRQLSLTILCVLFVLTPSELRPVKVAATEAQSQPTAGKEKETVLVGAIPGSFQVSRSGAATYRVKVKSPPGIQSVHPSLALAYSSQGGNGKLGAGWRLAGVSQISRSKAILAIDGFAGTINYDNNDRFSLNGERLIVVSGGNYHDKSAVYHTERETWRRVVPSYDGCSDGPCSFTVTTSRGMVMTFGGTPDSRIMASGGEAVRLWALNEMVDLHGNTMTISYQQNPLDGGSGAPILSPGDFYPRAIAYTSNTSAQFAANRFVDFTWEKRPDISQRYVGGYGITTAARLSRITTRIANQVVSDYRLLYEAAPVTGRSRLKSIQEFDGLGSNARCLPATVFDWQSQGGGFLPVADLAAGSFTANQGWGDETRYPRTSADVNGDGRMDLVGFGASSAGAGFQGVQVALSEGVTCAAAQPWTNGEFGVDSNIWIDQQQTPRFLLDVNADGLSDLIGYGSDGVRVGLSTGTGFDTSSWNHGQPYRPFQLVDWDPNLYPRTIGDVNGDQLVDMVGFKDGVQVAVSASGTSFSALTSWLQGDFSYKYNWDSFTPRIVADVNGDARADVIGFNRDGVEVALSTGTSFTKSGWDQSYKYFGYNQGWEPSLYPRMMADVNGDGLADIIGFRGGVQVGLSTGRGFLAPAVWNCGFSYDSQSCEDPVSGRSWTSSMPRQMADMNGDGLADVIGFNALDDGSGKVVVGLSTGTAQDGFITTSWNQNSLPNLNPNANPVILADINGDGLTDTVNFSDLGARGGLVQGPVSDLMTDLADGLGAAYSVTYQPLSVGAPLYAATNQRSTNPANVSAQTHSTYVVPIGTPVVPSYTMRHPIIGDRMNVVSKHSVSNVAAVNRSSFQYDYEYTYENAAISLDGRGWLGFQSVAVHDLDAGNATTRHYNQIFPFTGSLAGKRSTCLAGVDPLCKTGGAVLRDVDYTYLCESGNCTAPEQKICSPYPRVYQVLRSSQIDRHYSYGAFNFALGETTAYDQYGNKTLESNLGYVSETGQDLSTDDNVYTHSAYINDASANQFGRLSARLVSGGSYGPAWGGAKCTAPAVFNKDADFRLEARSYTASTWELASHCRWDDTNSVWLTTSYGYDPRFGNRTTVTAPGPAVTKTTYETKFNTYRDSLTTPPNASGKRFTMYFGHDPRFGIRVAHTDYSGNVFLYSLDSFGRAATRQGPQPDADVLPSPNCLSGALVAGSYPFEEASVVTLSTQSWNSDSSGGIYREQQLVPSWPTAQHRSSPIVNRDYVDALNRKYQQFLQDVPNADPGVVYTDWNSSNKVARKSLPLIRPANAASDPDDNTVKWVSHEYDAYGRRVRTTTPAGADGTQTSITTYSYQGTSKGATVTQVEAAEQTYRFTRILTHEYFNGKRRVTALRIPASGNATTKFAYDRLGRSTAHQDPAGATTKTSYDSLGRKLQTTSSASGMSSYAYDPGTGRLIKRTTPVNIESFAYDALGRLQQKKAVSVPQGEQLTVTYGYDDPGCTNAADRLTSVTTHEGGSVQQSRFDYCYDAYGGRAQTTLTLTGESVPFITQRSYDPMRRLVSVTYPGGGGDTLTHTFEGMRLSSVAVGNTTYAKYSAYTAQGLPQQIEYGNGVTERRVYAPQGFVNEQHLTDSQGAAVFDNLIQWDDLKQVRQIDDTISGETAHFGYSSRRLVNASLTGQGSQSYAYAPNGNITQKGGMGLHYDGQRALTAKQGGAEVWSAAYDAGGRMTTRVWQNKTYRYHYDPLGRLSSASNGTSNSSFIYNVRGQRIQKTDPDGTRTIYVNPYFEKVVLLDGSSQTTKYVLDSLRRIAMQTTVQNSSEQDQDGIPTVGTLYLTPNYLHSTSVTTDAAGKVATPVTYKPYGEISTIRADNFRYKYTAKEQDSTGLYYFNARYYDPVVAKFTTPDRGLGAHPYQRDALNRYEYALGQSRHLSRPHRSGDVGSRRRGLPVCDPKRAFNGWWLCRDRPRLLRAGIHILGGRERGDYRGSYPLHSRYCPGLLWPREWRQRRRWR